MFFEAQQDGIKLKTLFRQSEMNQLLKDCEGSLQQAAEVFNVRLKPFEGEELLRDL
jgi:hypothetical protein